MLIKYEGELFMEQQNDIRTYKKIKKIVSKKTGQEFLVIQFVQELIIPVTYMEKVILGNDDEVQKVVDKSVKDMGYSKNDKVYPNKIGRRY